MSRKQDIKPTMVLIHAKVKRHFKRALFDLDEATYAGHQPNQSNVTEALWDWFASLSPDESAAFLVRQFPLLEASMSGSVPGPETPVEPDVAGHDADVPPPKKRQGRTG